MILQPLFYRHSCCCVCLHNHHRVGSSVLAGFGLLLRTVCIARCFSIGVWGFGCKMQTASPWQHHWILVSQELQGSARLRGCRKLLVHMDRFYSSKLSSFVRCHQLRYDASPPSSIVLFPRFLLFRIVVFCTASTRPRVSTFSWHIWAIARDFSILPSRLEVGRRSWTHVLHITNRINWAPFFIVNGIVQHDLVILPARLTSNWNIGFSTGLLFMIQSREPNWKQTRMLQTVSLDRSQKNGRSGLTYLLPGNVSR